MITFRRTLNGNGVIVEDTYAGRTRQYKLNPDLNVIGHPNIGEDSVVVCINLRAEFPFKEEVYTYKVEDIVGRPSNDKNEVAVWLGDNFFFRESGSSSLIGIQQGIRLNFYDSDKITIPNINILPLHVDVWVRTTNVSPTTWGDFTFGTNAWGQSFPLRTIEGDTRLKDVDILSVSYDHDNDSTTIMLANIYTGTITLTY